MLILVSIISCILLLFSNVFGGQEFSIFNNDICDPPSSWTSWFNTQNPMLNNGNDKEDLAHIRVLYKEVDRCKTVSNVQYSIVQNPSNASVSYQTLINYNGLFCMGSRASSCPNYQVRFCCPRADQGSIKQCGQTFRQPYLHASIRIVNGIISNPHSFPWAVSLQYKLLHDCGGVIVDQLNILTAAHCLDYSNDLGNYFVRVGAHDRTSSGQLIPIAQLILHPHYNEARSTNDIGIIKLARPINFTETIQPICLLDNIVEPPLDTTVYVAGWGNTVFQMWDSSSSVLRQARLRVISNCSMYFAYESQRQICAATNGPADIDHGSCQGDSGGGLFYLKNERWYVAGVVSYATGCGQKAFPTVFTKTSAYIGWIREMINRPITA
ncbi:unnamed protein product [Rotaria sp. Silwood2]|nr:unnamed protein product [Rotaria sp. Silwood2]CAF3031938.1 unnamed protein product [Rotaria sp. Silwood2]CAF4106276.1 unnamed protein product [Rotaria sp. Silwood2]CAF4207173.1 unnamed protein product [Rotaria sp. Silwood2]CAF4427318.1 unnamed protein product [Rotaria sp. Silwood2]